MRNTLVLCSLVALVAGCATTSRVPALREADFERWRAYLAPRPEEVAWRKIPWLPSLAEGVALANQVEKPLLLWVMNGHPLGCT